jgi:hypothetical protein
MGFLLIFLLTDRIYVLKIANTNSIRKKTPMKSETRVGGSTYTVESTSAYVVGGYGD